MTTDTMTPRERFLAAIAGRVVDRTPVASPTSVATVEQMRRTGAAFPAVHVDGPGMARLAAGAHEILGYDAIMPVFSVVQEAAALGCEIDWGASDTMPAACTHPWSDPDQVTIPADFLERPPVKAVLDALRLLRREYGDRVALVGKVMGPWTLSYHVRGIQDFLADTLLEPENVRGFLDRLKVVTRLFGQAQIAAGADVLCLADHATGDLVRGAMYRDFLQPIHRELTRSFDRPVILHICGDTLDRIGFIADAGFAAFHFDSKVDAREAVQAAGHMPLVGNVNNPETLLRGTAADVEREARYAVEAGAGGRPECACRSGRPSRTCRRSIARWSRRIGMGGAAARKGRPDAQGNLAARRSRPAGALCRMGHGDEIVLADAHFPGESVGRRVVRADGLRIADLLDAILPLLELDARGKSDGHDGGRREGCPRPDGGGIVPPGDPPALPWGTAIARDERFASTSEPGRRLRS